MVKTLIYAFKLYSGNTGDFNVIWLNLQFLGLLVHMCIEHLCCFFRWNCLLTSSAISATEVFIILVCKNSVG